MCLIDIYFEMKTVNSQNRIGHCCDFGNLRGFNFLSINPNFEQLYKFCITLWPMYYFSPLFRV